MSWLVQLWLLDLFIVGGLSDRSGDSGSDLVSRSSEPTTVHNEEFTLNKTKQNKRIQTQHNTQTQITTNQPQIKQANLPFIRLFSHHRSSCLCCPPGQHGHTMLFLIHMSTVLCSLCLEDFRYIVVEIPYSCNCLICSQAVWWQHDQIFQRNMLSFVWKHFYFFWISWVDFHQGRSTPPTVTSSQGFYWYTLVSSPVTMSQRWGYLQQSNFLRVWVLLSTLPRFCSSLRLWGIHGAQCVHMPWQPWKLQRRLPKEIIMISCISASVCFGSFPVRDSAVERFPRITVIATGPQQSLSSNMTLPWDNGHCHWTTTVIVFQHDSTLG